MDFNLFRVLVYGYGNFSSQGFDLYRSQYDLLYNVFTINLTTSITPPTSNNDSFIELFSSQFSNVNSSSIVSLFDVSSSNVSLSVTSIVELLNVSSDNSNSSTFRGTTIEIKDTSKIIDFLTPIKTSKGRKIIVKKSAEVVSKQTKCDRCHCYGYYKDFYKATPCIGDCEDDGKKCEVKSNAKRKVKDQEKMATKLDRQVKEEKKAKLREEKRKVRENTKVKKETLKKRKQVYIFF
ncbi:hypothetical protein ABK040_005723 [Willaertia magna]